ncbi:unnamed protein product [Linum tenue]|uniref:Uncharacterized protein n=1 Tax=Linum tenue TaxID=586396 RepID=A0AAV0N2H0_9ROSI|nr:unnamed protein product [Linum tenue]
MKRAAAGERRRKERNGLQSGGAEASVRPTERCSPNLYSERLDSRRHSLPARLATGLSLSLSLSLLLFNPFSYSHFNALTPPTTRESLYPTTATAVCFSTTEPASSSSPSPASSANASLTSVRYSALQSPHHFPTCFPRRILALWDCIVLCEFFSSHFDSRDFGPGIYVMVVGGYFIRTGETAMIKVHKIVDLSPFPDREAMWYLEVMEAYKLFYQPLIEDFL